MAAAKPGAFAPKPLCESIDVWEEGGASPPTPPWRLAHASPLQYDLVKADAPDSNYLEDLLRELTEEQVQFVVAGGVAAVLHGVERTTMNLDIALEMSAENVARFKRAVSTLGLKPLVPVPIEVLADPKSVRQMVEEKNAIVFMLCRSSDAPA